jgi:type I restriction enzyme M protein
MVATHADKVNFIWSIANVLRGDYKQSDYQKVILPLTVLRRLDCVTEPTKEKVLREDERLEEQGIQNKHRALKRAAGQQVYNTSEHTFESLVKDPEHLADNLRYYMNSFDPKTVEILENFNFDQQIDKLEQANLLYQVVERFNTIDLHPDNVPNEEMGTIYEELIRKFSELSNETAGEHFTPREVIELMVELMFCPDDEEISSGPIVRSLYDPACGTGGMLTVAERYLKQLNQEAQPQLYGQELNDFSYAVCNSDMLVKGHNPDNIERGNSFSEDGFPSKPFDYMLTNPPFGVSWNKVADVVEKEYENQGFDGRFGAGTPRKSDGAFLFLQHMLSKMKPASEGGSRLAIVFNGSPLFTGGPNSGESAIRRWIIENDWLEAIIGLPENLFYNTGIHTYIWVLTNRKEEHREGKLQLIDAREMYAEMDESLGDKRHYLTEDDIREITRLYGKFEETGNSVILDNEDLGYRRIVIDRPLRLSFEATEERIQQLDDERAFTNREEDKQQAIKDALRQLPDEEWTSQDGFHEALDAAFTHAGLDVTKSVIGNIENALGERDPDAEICKDGNEPEHDTDLREYERIPLGTDPHEYFEQEVEPHVPDAWINEDKRYHDDKDGQLGTVGYEINFNRYFYEYEPPRDLEEINRDIKKLEGEIVELLEEVAS